MQKHEALSGLQRECRPMLGRDRDGHSDLWLQKAQAFLTSQRGLIAGSHSEHPSMYAVEPLATRLASSITSHTALVAE